MSRTILLVTPHLIARGDFDSRGRLQATAHAAPPSSVTDLASLTLAALGLVKAKPRRVFVLTTSAVTAVVETTPGRLQGLSENELSSALAFEAEALTGLPAMSSQTAARRMAAESGTESWWVTQIGNRMRGEIEAEVVRRGARMEGIAHPGGLATQMSLAPERFELWHDLLFIHRASAAFDILPVDETAPLASVLARFPATASARMVLATRPPSHITDLEVLSLHEENTLHPWFTAWHQALSEGTPALPVLLPPAQPMSAVSRVWLSVATAAIALTLCAGHWWMTERQLQHAQEEVKTLTTLSKQREELMETSAEVGKLRTELEASRRLQAQALRGFGSLLSAVAELRPEGLLVRSLKEPSSSSAGARYTGMEAMVSGLCTQQELAAAFSRSLGTRLTPLGWSVRPARTTARLAGGTPTWDFEIPLRLDGSASVPPTASTP
jgi:hypothetical protein